VSNERFNRTDASVTGQVLKIDVGAKPDAVLMGGCRHAGRAAGQRTLKERGYKPARYYQTHGVANNDFLRVGGKDVRRRPSCRPVRCWWPISCRSQQPGEEVGAGVYVRKYESCATARVQSSTFGGHAWDAGQLLQRRDPGGAEDGSSRARLAFRAALARRAGKPSRNCRGSRTASSTLTTTDHVGLDKRARVIVDDRRRQAWKLVRTTKTKATHRKRYAHSRDVRHLSAALRRVCSMTMARAPPRTSFGAAVVFFQLRFRRFRTRK
jgi:branched-chain amino acid transport system substrate-binding protein